jgi:hypothetical protein
MCLCDKGCVFAELSQMREREMEDEGFESIEELDDCNINNKKKELSLKYNIDINLFNNEDFDKDIFECGHQNYATSAYAVKNGHIDCLKILHTDLNCMWHSDLAIVAAESKQIKCLKYVVEKMGDVSVYIQKDLKYVKNKKCIAYLKKHFSDKSILDVIPKKESDEVDESDESDESVGSDKSESESEELKAGEKTQKSIDNILLELLILSELKKTPDESKDLIEFKKNLTKNLVKLKDLVDYKKIEEEFFD